MDIQIDEQERINAAMGCIFHLAYTAGSRRYRGLQICLFVGSGRLSWPLRGYEQETGSSRLRNAVSNIHTRLEPGDDVCLLEWRFFSSFLF